MLEKSERYLMTPFFKRRFRLWIDRVRYAYSRNSLCRCVMVKWIVVCDIAVMVTASCCLIHIALSLNHLNLNLIIGLILWSNRNMSPILYLSQRVFCSEKVEGALTSALAIAKAVRLGLNRIGSVRSWANGTLATFTDWRPSQSNICCESNVTCVIASFGNQLSGMWDDARCEWVRANPLGCVAKQGHLNPCNVFAANCELNHNEWQVHYA